MGQVFTWEAVKENRIPDPHSFHKVAEELQYSAAKEGSILGLILCGSAVYGEHTVRSDLDCFALYDVDREADAFRYMKELTSWSAQLHVPLAFIPCDSQLAAAGMHHVGESFRQHIEKTSRAGGILKGNPLPLVVGGTSSQEEIESYLRVKMYNLQEAWSQSSAFSEERMASFLKKLLEAPVHVARKVLAYGEVLESDSKSYILQRYGERLPVRLSEHLNLLAELDKRYTRWLAEKPAEPNKAEYGEVLNSVAISSEKVLAFIRENLLHLAAAR